MGQEFDRITLAAEGHVAVMAFNHPDVLNAVSTRMIKGALAALDVIESEAKFGALVLTGEGKGFCAGANLSEIEPGVSAGDMLEHVYHPFLRRLTQLRMPVVTAVNGPAVGIGMSFALSGDLTIAARSAFFQQGFSRLGLVPDGGSSWLLPRLIGLARGRELALLSEKLPAEKALEWGLINYVADDHGLRSAALALAAKLAAGPAALALTRRLFWESPGNSYQTQLALEQAAQNEAGKSADFQEGLAAFHEKRPPRFTGK
ncbi:MAG TPA: enoyl-CoA hydratase-related protein [Rhizomicrobium sp.]|jgi:2-(1,2-epoxy-1,2-dihydrophenyl)acetyl-CoA isomerase|nr:enoyl-CoA hydratase-related protein [Rhizomicrobium sp.]